MNLNINSIQSTYQLLKNGITEVIFGIPMAKLQCPFSRKLSVLRSAAQGSRPAAATYEVAPVRLRAPIEDSGEELVLGSNDDGTDPTSASGPSGGSRSEVIILVLAEPHGNGEAEASEGEEVREGRRQVQEVRDHRRRDPEVQALHLPQVHQRGRTSDGLQGLQLRSGHRSRGLSRTSAARVSLASLLQRNFS